MMHTNNLRGIQQKTCAIAFIGSCCLAATPWTEARSPDTNSTGKIKNFSVNGDRNSCAIEFRDPYDGRVGKARYSLRSPGASTEQGTIDLFIQFFCFGSDEANQPGFVPAKFDKGRMTWLKDFSGFSAEERALVEPVTRTFPLNTPNSLGIGVTEVMTPSGDNEPYGIHFSFCLRHPPVMLCGTANRVAYVKKKNSDKLFNNQLPIALNIIRALHFIDKQPSTSSSTLAKPSL